jgi:hypothetical protein
LFFEEFFSDNYAELFFTSHAIKFHSVNIFNSIAIDKNLFKRNAANFLKLFLKEAENVFVKLIKISS